MRRWRGENKLRESGRKLVDLWRRGGVRTFLFCLKSGDLHSGV
jgi:hypothetical protein